MEHKLSRRIAIQRFSYLIGGSVATPTLISIMQSCQQAPTPLDWTPKFLSDQQARMVSVLSELIIPRTETPGAIDAGVPNFVDQMLLECLNPEAQALFTSGLDKLQAMSNEQSGSDFMDLKENEQADILKQIASEKEDETTTEYENDPKTFFRQLKQLTLLGYFNSEMGATEALEYVQIPGSYHGCITMEPDQKAWAE